MSDIQDHLTTFDHEHFEYRRIKGTEDWVTVLNLNVSQGYEWTTFRAFYSPSARRYFWNGGAGCSCNSWGDDLGSSADFENGDKEALRRALHRFADDREWDTDFAREVPAAAGVIARHNPTDHKGA